MPKKANLNVSSRAEPSHLFHFFLFLSSFSLHSSSTVLYYFLFKSKRVAMLSRINSFAFSARDNYRCKNVERYSILFHRRIRQSFIFILCARRFRRTITTEWAIAKLGGWRYDSGEIITRDEVESAVNEVHEPFDCFLFCTIYGAKRKGRRKRGGGGSGGEVQERESERKAKLSSFYAFIPPFVRTFLNSHLSARIRWNGAWRDRH